MVVVDEHVSGLPPDVQQRLPVRGAAVTGLRRAPAPHGEFSARGDVWHRARSDH
ncbi:hypothetical protein [Streptomyces sp. NPDC057690]|uniref:hypothetical protein n=1 Tax=Streptomyces sp. NPDC057690 TaxID=3346214 RepID=UPI0036BDEAA9